MGEWRFTDPGKQEGDQFFTHIGYHPGQVVGEIQEADLFQILWFTYGHINSYPMGDEADDFMDGYIWKVEAQTNFLYDVPDRAGFDPTTQRIVSGAMGVEDELGWMGFAATFSGERLSTLALEVDTSWVTITELQYDRQSWTYKVLRGPNSEWEEVTYGS